MKPSSCLCLLLLASLFVVSSAVTVSPSETSRTTWRARPTALPDDDFLAHLCHQQRAHPATMRRLPWCQQLHARRRGGGGGGEHHVPMPPPGRDGEETDMRYGVSKRLVPGGPNPLHN